MNKHVTSHEKGVTVSVFTNGRSRAIRIPKDFEFSSRTVIMSKQMDGSILLRAGETAGLIDYLSSAEPWIGEPFLVDDDEHLSLD